MSEKGFQRNQNTFIKAAGSNPYENNVLSYLSYSLYVLTVVRETDNLTDINLALASALNALYKNPLCQNQNNQSEPGGVSDGVAITVHAQAAHAFTQSNSISLKRFKPDAELTKITPNGSGYSNTL